MATFDGTTNITATKDEIVLINVDPQTFTQATDNGTSVTLTFGTKTITITGTTFVDGGLPNVFVPGGVFAYGPTSINTLGNPAPGNELVILGPGTTFTQTETTTASSKVAIFGGLGRVDNSDTTDTIQFGGKGSFLVFGNKGDDTITQNATFDSTSIVNVNGDAGDDFIVFSDTANSKASIFIGGGAGEDSIGIYNSGFTTLFGGLDSTDAADLIQFEAVSGGADGGAGGFSTISGNGGGDQVFVGFTNALDSTSSSTVFGGFGDDSVTAVGVKATLSVLGNEGADTITVSNTGSTFITGGNQSGDQALDSADIISFTGTGSTLIYGNVGDDQITAALGNATVGKETETSTISIYGGKNDDTITQTIVAGSTGKATVFIAGGEGTDTITAIGNGGGVTIYGGISDSDSTDAADTINYGDTSTGVANIFGNGGADTINIGTLGDDSTNTVTVRGGIGNDSINVAEQTGTQKLVVTSDAGADSITIANDASVGQTITITDFAIGAGGDKLTITGVSASTLQVTSGGNGTLQGALDQAAAAGGNVANQAGAIVFDSSTYIVVDNNGDGLYTAASEQAIKLTGVTDLVGLAAQTSITV